MKKLRFVSLIGMVGLIGILCTGCGVQGVLDMISDHDGPEETETYETTASDDHSEEISETAVEGSTEIGTEAEELDLVSEDKTEKVHFDNEKNGYTEQFADKAEGDSLYSIITDMDNDGKNEAFVIDGSEDRLDSLVMTDDEDQEYLWAYHAWFVDESGKAKEVSELTDGGLILSLTQKSFMSGESTYIILNGYAGVDGQGYVYTLKDDELVNAAPDAWAKGHKDYNGNELVWEMECEGTNVDDGQIYGHFWMPYYLYNEDGIFKPYDAKEVSKDAIIEMAEINLDYLDDAKKCQFVLRDNNELDVNYMTDDEDEYTVSTDVYNLSEDGSAWEKTSSSDGYHIVDIKNPDEADFLAEWQ